MIKPVFLITATLVFLSIFSCSTKQSFQYQTSHDVKTLLETDYAYPDAKFIVLTDLHFYDKSLGTTGKVFQEYLDNDRKLLVLSDEILSTAIEEVIKENADFILVPGDLTKDGEKLCHQGVVKALKKIESTGVIIVNLFNIRMMEPPLSQLSMVKTLKICTMILDTKRPSIKIPTP